MYKREVESMSMLTQGSIVTSVRTKKYDDCKCYGVVISARCDIANKKIEKIYYLEAIEFKDWITSGVCSSIVISQKVKNVADKLKKFCDSNSLDWDTIKNFSVEEFTKVVISEVKVKGVSKYVDSFAEYKRFVESINLSEEQKKALFSDDPKLFYKIISDVADGKYMHFTYIPSSGFKGEFPMGIIVDLQELDYFDFETTYNLEQCNIDSVNSLLSDEELEKYNMKFVLDRQPGYAVELCKISSPWIEFLMQRFSNAFIRIGVDNPSKDELKDMVYKIIDEVK